MSASELAGLDREFDSLFRSQVRELESETMKAPSRKRLTTREQRPLRELEPEATPLRALPKFKRTLVESRRAMRSRAASTTISAALFASVPMTILTATTR